MVRSAGSRPEQGTGLALAVRARGLAVCLLLTAVSVGIVDRAAAQSGGPQSRALTVAETEALVRAVHYEGLPEEEAARIGADGAARLVEMLGDPDEKSSHGRILLALGISGAEGAYEAIRDYSERAFVPAAERDSAPGEIDRDTFRAWQILPFALGKLAPRDPRAVTSLAECFDAAAPTWRFRHFDGPRLQSLERRAAAAALAETALPEALRVLDGVERRGVDPDLEDYVRTVRVEAQARAAGTPQ